MLKPVPKQQFMERAELGVELMLQISEATEQRIGAKPIYG
jgi:hypothetical protein